MPIDIHALHRLGSYQDYESEQQPGNALEVLPSAVKEYQYFSSLSPQEQQAYLNLKRSHQVIDLGDQQIIRSASGDIDAVYPVKPKPEDMPGFKAAQEEAKLEKHLGYKPRIKKQEILAEETARKKQELEERLATLPQLQETAENLSELGQTATYTKLGQAYDVARKELGLTPRQSAIDRAEYIALVDNQILPLLRQTFGAAFTQKEGESLKATLGDANKTPDEKDAVLRAFIQQKIATIEAQQKELGLEAVSSNNLYERNKEAFYQRKKSKSLRKKRLRYNPDTGNFE